MNSYVALQSFEGQASQGVSRPPFLRLFSFGLPSRSLGWILLKRLSANKYSYVGVLLVWKA